jgi:hypothetical protein
MRKTMGSSNATARALPLALAFILSTTVAVAYAQAEKRPCPDTHEKATAAEQALCWFQRDSSRAEGCADEPDGTNACVSQAAAWCADASLDIDPVTDACMLSAVRMGQLGEAREIAGYLRSPTKKASLCREALKMATIRIVSNPAGAEISVNDRSYGRAPVEVRLTGDWWESRIVARFGADPDTKQVEVSRAVLLEAFDRRECVFGDLVIDESAEEAAPPPLPAAAAPAAESQPPAAAGPEKEPEPEPAAGPAADTEPSDTGAQLEVDSGGSSIYPYVFMGVGGALILGSVVTGVLVVNAESELDDKCDPTTRTCDTDKSTLEDGNVLAIVTDVLLFTGIGAVSTGIFWLLLDSGESEPEPAAKASAATAPSLSCSPDGCLGRVTVSF